MLEHECDDLVVDFDGAVAGEARERARQTFARHGCFLARGLFHEREFDPIRSAIRRVIGLRRGKLGLPVGPADGSTPFDDGFLDLVQRDPDNRRVLQMTASFALPIHQIGASDRLARLSEMLMETDAVIGSDLQGLHVNLPGEEKHLLPWHQDYPWVQDSEDGVIYWMPLRELPVGNAALRVALGSHRLGVVRLLEREGRLMGLADPAIPERFPQRVISVRPGEILVVHTLVLHRSVPNRSDRVRWTMQVRHGNFAHPKAVRRNWPGPRPDRTPFSVTHPEYFVDPPLSTDPASPALPVAR